eukprot:TRINITY_DN58201_c0_g1_i1.p1 TRINITY_DN58201_c0_g1~~TRINITY_DN58201_c0_g1_i1.p1  ORF type:complete len:1469 (+),score=331.35 TRINITY_DN58201_c0_g1_i1:26-4408(+)
MKQQQSPQRSSSLPALVQPRGQVADLLAYPGLRHTQSGAFMIGEAKKKDHLRLIATASAKGNLPALRSAVMRAGDMDLLKRTAVRDASMVLQQAKKSMILCENAYRKFEAAGMIALFRSADELERLGPSVWRDPKYPLLRQVKEMKPYFSILKSLARADSPRTFAEQWLAAVESGELSDELAWKTAKWIKSDQDASEVFRDVLQQNDVRLTYDASAFPATDEELIEELQARFTQFGLDAAGFKFRPVRPAAAVAVTASDQHLFRLRRLNAGTGEPKLREEEAFIETVTEREKRLAALLLLSRLDEEEAPNSTVREVADVSTPRGAKSVAKKGAQPRGSISRALAIKENLEKRRDREHQKKEDRAKYPSMADDLPSLKRQLKRQFGTLAAAWTKGLDLDGNARINFSEFCEAMRRCHYKGDFKATFQELDQDGNNFITLSEVDLKTHELLQTFEALCLDNYGSFYKAWQAFDEDGNGYLTESEFIRRAQALGYRGDCRKLFKNLLSGHDANYVYLQDFAPEAFAQSLEDPEYQKGLSRKERIAKRRQGEMDNRMERFDLDALKQNLISKYGSLASAWKYGLDIDRNGKITFNEFSRAVRDVGFHGNIKAIWKELNLDDSNDISLEELDPIAHQHLSSFQQHVISKHEGYLEAWQKLKIAPGTRIHEPQFRKMCKDLGYKGDVHELFKHLQEKPGVPSFSLTNLDPRVLRESFLNPERKNPLSRKAKVEAWKDSQQAKDKGASDLKAVRTILLNQYGTIPCAWKHALDVDGNGKVSFVEFGNAMRRLGYKGIIKDLWVQIDKDGSGFITMDEIDSKAYRMLEEFREFVLTKFAGWAEAWDFIDYKNSRRVRSNQFLERCEAMGYHGDAQQLYKYYLDDPSADFIVLADLDRAAAEEAYLDPERFNTKLKKEEYERRQAELAKQLGDKVASDVPSLIRMLVRKYGTITSAWRHGLDLRGNGRISYMEFCRAMQQLCVRGDVRSIWKALDLDGNGNVTLGELDPAADMVLTDFHDIVKASFGGNYIEAWRELDIGKKGRLTEEDFVERCDALGYNGDASLLFKYLLDKVENSFITLDDLDPQAAHELRMNGIEKKQAAIEGRDMGAADFPALKQLLVRKYGTMPAAWKHGLDPGDNGFVGFVEFCKCCRKVGFIGSPRQIWSELEKDPKGQITMSAFDAQAHAALTEFRQLVLERYGNWLEAWHSFDANKNGAVDSIEFTEICEDIGYKGDAEQLFEYLLDEPCCDTLTLDDLDPAAAHESRLDPDRHDTGKGKKKMLEQQAQEQMARRKHVMDLPTLKRDLLHKFGTPTAVWKHGLDRNGDGHIGYMEFCAALREVSFRGPVKKLWLELDADNNGQISLEEFDKESHDILAEYHSYVIKKFGSFAEAFSMEGEARFNEYLFHSKCKEIGYLGDVALLYKLLLDKPLENSHWLLPGDLEPHHLKKRGRALQRELKEKLISEGHY